MTHDSPGLTRRTLIGGAVAAAAVVGAGAAPASAAGPGYLSVPYSSTLLRDAGGTLSPASWGQWSGAGFPAPQPAAMQYAKYPWMSSIYARATPSGGGGAYWKALDGGEWKRAGYPSPRGDLLIPGTRIYKWGFWSTIFCELEGVHHALNMSEWRSLGAPAPQLTDSGFAKLSWDSGIAYLTSLRNGTGYPINATEWRAMGTPPPFEAVRFPGDRFETYGDSTIYYFSPTYAGPITYAQWQAAGRPAPIRKG